MTPSKRFGIAVVALVVGLVLFSGYMAAGKRPPKVEASAFAQAVDLEPLENLAVHTDGRLKSFASFAHEMMGFIMGPRKYEGQTPSFSYLDLMFRTRAYDDADIIFVKNKNLRRDIVDAYESSQAYSGSRDRPRLEAFMKWGLISQVVLNDMAVQARFEVLETDLMRSARFIEQVRGAQSLVNSSTLRFVLRLIPPSSGEFDVPWTSPAAGSRVDAADPAVGERVAGAWSDLERSWVDGDAVGANAAVVQLASLIPTLSPELYPDTEKLSWESWYFRNKNMNWVWVAYLAAVIILLMKLVYGWTGAYRTGMTVFVIAFLLQSAAVGLRWWVSGRWPNSNMYEAVTTSAWMGGVAAIAFEWYGRKSAMAGLFALTSAAASMVALMSASFLPVQLNPNIGNMMPVLHDLWLYIHTNVIIWSYILIFMAAISGLLYLVHRACGAQRENLRMAGAAILEIKDEAVRGLQGSGGMQPALAGASAGGGDTSEMTAAAATADEVAGGATGAALADPAEARASNLGVVLDGVTMVLMKLSFVMLWAGLVMGAIWADHSWGRPWGWDPKEVFALCTFIIFAVLVHVRWKARDKGLWTALLAVIGAGVMLFNWIVINFYISGLHSYA